MANIVWFFNLVILLFMTNIVYLTNGDDRYRNGCMGVLEPPCRCNKVMINCTNANFQNIDIFMQITDTHFPDLDTLIMTGNNFSILEHNLFGPTTKHKSLTKIVLNNNKIKRVQINAFNDNAPRLEQLALNDNLLSVKDLRSVRYFDRLYNLKILELQRAFDFSEVSDLHDSPIGRAMHVIFSSKCELTQLEYLDLQDNHMDALNESIFCNLPVLSYLYLQNNALATFSITKMDCVQNLYELHLENNKIGRLGNKNIDGFTDARHLLKIFFAGNPIDCTADQRDFIKWLKTSDRVQDKNMTKCSSVGGADDHFKNQPITDVEESQLTYESDGSGYMHGVYIICGIAIVGLAAMLFCLFYANRNIICARRKSGMLLTSGGYEILNKEPEVKAEMV